MKTENTSSLSLPELPEPIGRRTTQAPPNDGLGPLPAYDVTIYDRYHGDEYAYSANAMEAERQRCYAAGVAAERERCAKIVDMPPETEAWEVIGGEEGLTMLRELAALIRKTP